VNNFHLLLLQAEKSYDVKVSGCNRYS